MAFPRWLEAVFEIPTYFRKNRKSWPRGGFLELAHRLLLQCENRYPLGGSSMLHPTNGDTRRYRRWVVGGRLAAKLGGNPNASLVDISLGGALVEHSNMMKPGSISFLTLSFDRQEEVLKCRVVRSVGHRYEVWPTGERDLVYRTGIEFLDLSESSLGLIDKSIESLKVLA